MPQIVLVLIVVIVLIVASRRVRSIVFHRSLLRFLKTLLVTTVILLVLAGIGFAAWYWWTVIRLAAPGTSWNDMTIRHESHPFTPGTGGPVTPTKVE